MRETIVELWSDLECAAGVRRGSLTVVSGSYSDQVDNTDSCSFVVLEDSRCVVGLREVLRVIDPLGNVREYRVKSKGLTLDQSQRVVKGVSPINDLSTSGKVRVLSSGITTHAVTVSGTTTEMLTDTVYTNRAADGLPWLALETVDNTTELPALTSPETGWTRMQWVRAIVDQTKDEIRLVRYGSTAYKLNVVDRIGFGSPVVSVISGKNLLSLTEEEDDRELVTAVTCLGRSIDSVRSTIGENCWKVGVISGGGPAWVQLTDPNGGAFPIVFDGQLNLPYIQYLLTRTGTTVAVMDSRAIDSAVYVTSTAGLVEDDLVQVVVDTSATRVIELVNPDIYRLHKTQSEALLGSVRNISRNGKFNAWSSLTSADYWAAGGGTGECGQQPVTTPADYAGVVANGAQTAGATTLNVSGLPANALLFLNEEFVIVGKTANTISATVQADGSGNLAIPLDVGGLDANIANGDALVFCWAGVTSDGLRPTSYPTGTTGTMMRLTNGYMQGESYTVKYIAGLAHLNLSVDVSMRTGASSGTYTVYPYAAILDVVGTTNLALANQTSLSAFATVHSTLSASALLTTNKEVAVTLTRGSMGRFQAVRSVMLWLSPTGGASLPEFVEYSGANDLWHAANETLLSRSITTKAIRITIRDLSQLAGYSVTREQLTLGGDIEIVDRGLTVRILGITYSATDALDVDVLISAKPIRASRYLAELI